MVLLGETMRGSNLLSTPGVSSIYLMADGAWPALLNVKKVGMVWIVEFSRFLAIEGNSCTCEIYPPSKSENSRRLHQKSIV